jgi:murein DD-endopeptidase MepM/ murein hydrolase activator NlpD
MPNTWKEWGPKVGATDPFNEMDSAKVAAAYLAWIRDNLPGGADSIKQLMLGYNMGIGNMTSGVQPGPANIAYAENIQNQVLKADGGKKSGVPDTSVRPTIMPFAGDFPLTQEFGVNPERYKSWGGHMGLDYKMPTGTPILATQDGTVVDTGYSPAGGNPSRPGTGGFGNWIIVQYPDGYVAEYAHLEKQLVKPGDTVSAGQTIGLSDHTGVSDFPHLHFGVRKDGKYIDPHAYLDMLASSPGGQPASSPVSPESSPAVAPTVQPVQGRDMSVPTANAPVQPAATPAASPQSGLMPWTGTPDQLLNDFNNRNNSPERVAAQDAVTQAFADIKQRAQTTYPDYASLYDEYQTVPQEQRQQWTNDHPMIRALNMAGYNPDQWKYLEDTFGKGIVEKWANIPPYTGEAGDERSQYYHQYPDVFLANAYVRGRPEVYDESNYDPNKSFAYNFGQDYKEAQSKFGAGIWDTVRQYYTIPPYVKGGDNKAWVQFKTDHPEFDQWRAWWYEKLGAQAASTYQPFQQYGGHVYNGFSGGRPGVATPRHLVEQVAYQSQQPPAFHAPGGTGAGDWRQWLSLTEADLKRWRG